MMLMRIRDLAVLRSVLQPRAAASPQLDLPSGVTDTASISPWVRNDLDRVLLPRKGPAAALGHPAQPLCRGCSLRRRHAIAAAPVVGPRPAQRRPAPPEPAVAAAAQAAGRGAPSPTWAGDPVLAAGRHSQPARSLPLNLLHWTPWHTPPPSSDRTVGDSSERKPR